MTRWIVTSFALHMAMLGVLFVASLRREVRPPLPLLVELAPAPAEAAPEETPAPVATPAPTAPSAKPTAPPATTKPPTPKKEPTVKPSPKPARKPTVKPTAVKQVKQEETIDRRKLLDRLRKSRSVVSEVLDAPPATPPPVRRPVPTRPPAPRPVANPSGNIAFEAKGLESQRGNFYFTMMSRLFYENWQVPARSSGDDLRSGKITVVVKQDGSIDLARCRWTDKSGRSAFDDSVWACVRQTVLPPIPAEFRKSEIEVTVTFKDEA